MNSRIAITKSPGILRLMGGVTKTTGWYIAAAILFIVAGAFAIIEPTVAGLGISIFIAWALIFGGVAHIISAFKGGRPSRVALQIIAGMAYLAAGLYFRAHPILAIGTLTLVLGIVILAGGLLEVMYYMRVRGRPTSRWVLFNGLISVLLGGLIWIHWPSSSAWALGCLVGINLLVAGASRLTFALVERGLSENS